MKNENKMLGLYVEVKDNNVDKALRKFKKKIKDSGLMLELKSREYYEKPSAKKRQDKKKALRRNRIRTIMSNK